MIATAAVNIAQQTQDVRGIADRVSLVFVDRKRLLSQTARFVQLSGRGKIVRQT
jgi:hypothetical protein